MERVLYFDCFAGISGDMSIGALVDLGLDPSAVIDEIKKLGVKGYDIEINKISRYSISGTDVKVTLNAEVDCVHEHDHDGHTHDHGGHTHDHGHGHSHLHDEKERSLSNIVHIIRSSGISDKAKQLSIAI